MDLLDHHCELSRFDAVECFLSLKPTTGLVDHPKT